MLEASKVRDRRAGKLVKRSGVELFAWDRQRHIAGMHERSENHHDPFGLEPEPRVVFHTLDVGDELSTIEDLSLPFLGEQLKEVLRIPRLLGSQAITVEQLEGVERG